MHILRNMQTHLPDILCRSLHAYDDHPHEKEILKQKVETLQADLSRRQESYIRRERAFNVRIEELEDEVQSLKVRTITYTLRNDSKQ